MANLVFSVDEAGQDIALCRCGLQKIIQVIQITQPISFEAEMSLDTGDDGGVFMQITSQLMVALRYGGVVLKADQVTMLNVSSLNVRLLC